MKIKRASVLCEHGDPWSLSGQDFRLETEENGSILVVEGDRGCYLVALPGCTPALKVALSKSLRQDRNYGVLFKEPRKVAFTLRRLLTKAGLR